MPRSTASLNAFASSSDSSDDELRGLDSSSSARRRFDMIARIENFAANPSTQARTHSP